jgi:hypothetical protein
MPLKGKTITLAAAAFQTRPRRRQTPVSRHPQFDAGLGRTDLVQAHRSSGTGYGDAAPAPSPHHSEQTQHARDLGQPVEGRRQPSIAPSAAAAPRVNRAGRSRSRRLGSRDRPTVSRGPWRDVAGRAEPSHGQAPHLTGGSEASTGSAANTTRLCGGPISRRRSRAHPSSDPTAELHHAPLTDRPVRDALAKEMHCSTGIRQASDQEHCPTMTQPRHRARLGGPDGSRDEEAQ